jgi:hypothetical protein
MRDLAMAAKPTPEVLCLANLPDSTDGGTTPPCVSAGDWSRALDGPIPGILLGRIPTAAAVVVTINPSDGFCNCGMDALSPPLPSPPTDELPEGATCAIVNEVPDLNTDDVPALEVALGLPKPATPESVARINAASSSKC